MEQNKRSAVTNVTANGTYNGQYGMLYKFQISFANGDVAEYNAKTQNQTKFVVGQEVDYVLTDREYQGTIYYKCKPAEVQQGGFSGGGFQAPKPKDPDTGKHIMRMSVLKVAGDLVINGDIKLHEILSYAQIFENFVNNGVDTLQNAKPTSYDNDLPF